MRNDLVTEARSWIGTPVRDRGRRKGVAADCIFLEEVFRVVAGYEARHDRYSMMPKNRQIEAALDGYLICVACSGDKPVSFRDLLPGRVALFIGANPNEPQHLAMIADHPKALGAKTVIHAYGDEREGGKVCEHTLCTAATLGRNGEVRSIMGKLWKLYDLRGVNYGH